MTIEQKLQLEREWHESEDFARDANSLIVGVYGSSLFAEAESFHFAALGDVAGKHVLDYGCGTGDTTVRLLAGGASVTGFDISHQRLEDARVRTAASVLPKSFLQCAAELLPFDDCTFDLVFGKQILHHLELKTAVREIARVLRPGGRAVFLEPLIHNPILEGYRRLTPHLRSPTERALSMKDIDWVGSNFSRHGHREFILMSVLPVLAASVTRPRPWLASLEHRLRSADRALLDAFPYIGRYYWETVITLEK